MRRPKWRYEYQGIRLQGQRLLSEMQFTGRYIIKKFPT